MSAKLRAFSTVSSALWILASVGAAQERPVSWDLRVESDQPLRASERVFLQVSAAIEPGWYIYSLTQPPGGPTRTSITLEKGEPFQLAGPIDAPEPESYPDRNFNLFTETYRSGVIFKLPVRIAPDATDGSQTLTTLVRFQTCNDRVCLPARTDTLKALVALARAAESAAEALPASDVGEAPALTRDVPGADVLDTTARAEAGVLSADDSDESSGRSRSPSSSGPSEVRYPSAAERVGAPSSLFPASEGSLQGFLWLAAIMGLLSLLTPCVFPMVPITVGFFTRDEAGGRRGGTRRAAAYAGGIVAAFCALGLLVSVAFGAGGVIRLAANPWLNLAVAALFMAFALNLLGVYELALPSRLLSRFARGRESGGGIRSALVLGAVFAVTTFTCTAPFVGTLLVLATQGSWEWPLLGLLVFSAAFALPFFALAAAPNAVARLPRSGNWMLTLRRVIGILELAAAAKFLSNVDLVWRWGLLTREVVIGIWTILGLLLAAVLAYEAARDWQKTAGSIPVRALLSVGALGVTFWVATGLRGTRLGELEAFLPPTDGVLNASAEELPWRMNDFQGSLAQAGIERRPLLIDFTGYTCTNCRWMEANMFPRPEVRAHLQGFVRVRLFTDGQGEMYRRHQALEERLFGTVALPLYAILTPSGEPVETFLGMTRNEKEFTDFLSRGLDRARMASK